MFIENNNRQICIIACENSKLGLPCQCIKTTFKIMKDIYDRTIEKWGHRSQLEMAQEEATELALAVRKHIRKNDEDSWLDMCYEIADVEIMIEQIKRMFPSSISAIEQAKSYKLERLEKRLNENKYED